jgi:PAS domain S-box-containing protein
MDAHDQRELRQLLDDYLELYASRDERLTARFSDDFSGFTGGGDRLVHDREEWVAITRQDFAQIKGRIRIELKDVAIQSLADTVAVATSFFTIHLPVKDEVLARETARLVLVFRKEQAAWKIAHSSISIPYHLVHEGEVYPLDELRTRNQELEALVAERTRQLTEANASLRRANENLNRENIERKQADYALQQSEARYRSIVNASPDDITITDAAGRILMVSPTALTMFGYTGAEEFVGRPLTDFLVPEDRARASAQILLKVQGVATGPSEYRALRPDGSTFDVEVNSEFMRDTRGSPTGMVVIARDISERKRGEADRAQLEAQSRQLQRVESLGRMAAAIAHRFNNSLHAVMTGLELALEEVTSGGAAVVNLTDALASARAAAEVSHSMLTYLGQAGGKREALDLSDACLRGLALLREVVPPSVKLETDLTTPGPHVSANEGDLQQALGNLITNAWEASSDGQGTVRIKVRTVAAAMIPTRRRFPVDAALTAASYACLEVSDAGCGVAAKDFESLFDPFFSSKFAGRGLGLPVVLGIVRAHGGAITVDSEPNRGSTFSVYLPVTTDAVAAHPLLRDDGDAPQATAARGAVLVVDDDAPVRRAVARALTRRGFTVLTAEDGVQALAVLREHRDGIGCVLCDVTMPRMNGWQTLAAIRAMTRELPVILASGYSEAQVMEADHPEQPQAFLSKPYDLQTLAAVLADALAARTPGPATRS